MARWQDIEDTAPDFAAALRARLDAHTHKTLATLRRDGSPRISATEVFFADGELWFGSMPQARKALDLRRDARFALHSGSDDPPGWDGDAKLSGRARELTDPAARARLFSHRGKQPPSPASHLFAADIREAVVISLNAQRTRLVIDLWRPGRGVTRTER